MRTAIFTVYVSGQEIAKPERPRAMSFKHVEEENAGKRMELVLEDADLTLIDDPLFTEGAEVTWRYGYHGRLSPLFKGTLAETEPSFDAAAGMTLTLIAFDGVTVMLKEKRQKAWRGPPGVGYTESDIVGLIAAKYGLRADVEPSKHYQQVWHQNASDWDFIKNRLSKSAVPADASKRGNYKLRLSADNRALIWRPNPMGAPSRKTYSFYLENDHPELISFQPRVQPHDPDKNAANGTRAAGVDKDGNVVDETASNETESTRYAGGEGKALTHGVSMVTSEEDGTVSGEVVSDYRAEDDAFTSEMAQETAGNAHNEAEMTQMEADLEAIMDPSIRRGRVIDVNNVGKKYSGRYVVHRLEVDIGTGGGINKLQLKRNAVRDAALAAAASTGQQSGGADSPEVDDNAYVVSAVDSGETGAQR